MDKYEQKPFDESGYKQWIEGVIEQFDKSKQFSGWAYNIQRCGCDPSVALGCFLTGLYVAGVDPQCALLLGEKYLASEGYVDRNPEDVKFLGSEKGESNEL